MSNTIPNRRWLKLDNAAKIYPAASTREWIAMFRESATLTEPVDTEVLEKALGSVLARMPSFAMRLRAGVFWYYLEHVEGIPPIDEDARNPCTKIDLKKNRLFSLRVRCFERRIAVEYTHTLTDGMGGLIFLKTLVARYVELKYGETIPKSDSILDCSVPPDPADMQDGFMQHAGKISYSRSEPDSYRIRGTKEIDRFTNLTTGIIDSELLRAKAREKGATVSEYLAAAMIASAASIQKRHPYRKKPQMVKVSLPVNLRRMFPSKTLRNFASYINIGIDPKLGDYSFDEIIKQVHHQMGLELTPKALRAKFSTNVQTERNLLLRLAPLFLKNIAMKAAFRSVGDPKTTTCMSNLGVVTLPPELEKYVERMDFILGPLSINPVACGLITYGGKLYFNFTRTIEEPVLEREFFTFLVKQGIPVLVESNRREN